MQSLRPAAFFDRDGVINEDTGYLHDSAGFRLLAGIAEAIRDCNAAGLLVFVVTNQSGVARGYFDETAVSRLNRYMVDRLATLGARIDDVRYCPHHPDGAVPAFTKACFCRKPRPGMLLDLIAAWGIDPARSFMIGDKPSDIDAAEGAGVRGYLLEDGDVLSLTSRALHDVADGTPPAAHRQAGSS